MGSLYKSTIGCYEDLSDILGIAIDKYINILIIYIPVSECPVLVPKPNERGLQAPVLRALPSIRRAWPPITACLIPLFVKAVTASTMVKSVSFIVEAYQSVYKDTDHNGLS